VTGGIALGMCDCGNISDEDDTVQDIGMKAKLEDDGGNSALRLNRGVEAARMHGNCTGSAQARAWELRWLHTRFTCERWKSRLGTVEANSTSAWDL
jgi:hypothetical protein